MPAQNRRRIRNLFPEPSFQFRFLRYLLLGTVIQIALTAILLYYFVYQSYSTMTEFATVDETLRRVLFGEMRCLFLTVFLLFIVYLSTAAILGILFSHRVGGAIYALKRTIRDINNGKDVELKLRGGDEFQELQNEFNKMASRLKKS